MAATWSRAPWVEEHRDRVGFALQAFPNDTPTDKARHLLAAGRLAEALGFDAFFVGDHPGWALDPWPHLPPHVDNPAGGRLVPGLGCGWDGAEFAKLGQPFPSVAVRQVALDEAVAIIRGVWGDAPFTFAGRHFRCAGASVSPRPVQRPG